MSMNLPLQKPHQKPERAVPGWKRKWQKSWSVNVVDLAPLVEIWVDEACGERVTTFKLPKLDYSNEALSPIMSQETLELHHGKHHQTYITNLNNFIKDTDMAEMSLEDIIVKSSKDNSKAGIFNNASQHWNHNLFWKCMKPKGGGNIPSKLEKKIIEDFGSVEKFKDEFKQAGITQFGSGWCWLSLNNDKLVVTKTANAANPLIDNLKPILGCDVWEHSYYIDYRNRRPEYLDKFVDNLIDWEFVESLLI